MKSKLFKILGVIAAVAMIAAAIVAPVSATVSAVTVSTTTAGGIISATGNYSIYATIGTQLMGAANGAITLPDVGDAITFASTLAYDKVTVAGAAILAITPTGTAGIYTASTGVIVFTAGGQTCTFTATARGTAGTYTVNQGKPTISNTDVVGPAATNAAGAFTLPDAGSNSGTASTVKYTAALAGNQVTIAITAGSATPTYTAGDTYVGGLWTATAGGDILTLTATADNTTGTYALTTGAAVPSVGVAVGNDIASFTSVASGDSITVTFPSTFTVSSTGLAATVAATTGWVTFPGTSTAVNVASMVPPAAGAVAAVPSASSTLNTVTLTLPAGDYIGAGAQILINITGGVTNPSVAGSYTLTVQTSQETTPVTSATFAISNPTIPVVSGVATVYNTAATPVLMTQSNSLNAALNAAILVAGGATIKLTAGTYSDTNVGTPYTATLGTITIQGTDASAANVIIKSAGNWVLTGTAVAIVIDSVTIDGTNGTLSVSSTNKAVTVSNSIITKGALTIGAGAGGSSNITKDTFTVATGKNGLTPTGPTTVTGSTFTITGTGWGIFSPANVTVSGCTFTGVAATAPTYTGQGINLTGGSGSGSTIGTSTFTGLSTALTTATGFSVSFIGNTVTACGMTTPTGVDAIMITSVGASPAMVYILNNKITNSLEYIINVAANDNQVFVNGNQFSGNVKSAFTLGPNVLGPLNVTHNYWGGTPAAPGNPASVTTGTQQIDYTLPLGAAASASTSVALSTGVTKLDATATAGANITAVTGTMTQLGASALGGNPVGPALPSTVTVVKYFDVFGIGGTGAIIDFYGPTAGSITANSAIYFYNTAFGTWQLATKQTVNVFGNYVEVTIDNVPGDVPTPAQFAGLPFALVTVPTTLGAPTPGAGSISPTNGATGVPVSGVTFTWPVVTPPAGSTITYQFALAQASANTSANEFAILDYSDNSITNAEPNQETLQYNTVYWWEVRAVTMSSTGAITATGPWTISMFTTAPQAVATTPAVTTVVSSVTTVVTTNVNVTSPVTTITFTQPTPPASTPVIPSYLLWAVIAVGAILVIAVIVLIVRTRRIP